MKTQILLIISLVSILFSCSKEEDDPQINDSKYREEQFIGEWVPKKIWDKKKYPTERWEDYDKWDYTTYTFHMNNEIRLVVRRTLFSYIYDGTWRLQGNKIYYEYDYKDGATDNFNIESIGRGFFISDRGDAKVRYEKKVVNTDMSKDLVGKWILNSEFKNDQWVYFPGYEYICFYKDGTYKYANSQSTYQWTLQKDTITCDNGTDIITYNIVILENNRLVVIKTLNNTSDSVTLKYYKD